MKKLVYLVVLGAVLLAACGSGSNAVAATVDSQDITVGDVEALMDSDGATVTKDVFAQFLTYEIQWVVINDSVAEDFGISITDEEAAAEADRIYEEFAEDGQTREEFVASRGVTEEFLQNIARQGLMDTQIREILKEDVAEPTQEEIDAARADAVTSLTSICASHILVATQEEADDVMSRLDEGEDFGELAVELSTDTASGANDGALGCSSPDAYVDEFAAAIEAAPVGEVYEEVVETQFGFHVIMVTEREDPAEADVPTDESLIDDLKNQAVGTEVEEWFLTALEDADVVVTPEYGTWQPNPPTVVPPAEESTSTTILDGTTTTTTE